MPDRMETSGPPSGHSLPDDPQEVSRVIHWVSVLAFPLLTFYAVRAHLQDAHWNGLVLQSFSLLLLLNMACFLRHRRHELYKWLFTALIGPMFIYVNLAGLEEGAGILWLYAFPPLVFYISDLRIGALFAALTLAAVLVLFTPLGRSLGAAAYPSNFQLVFLSALAFEFFFCYMLDRSRRQNSDRLVELARQFEYAAKHDALTGLANRREGGQRLKGEYARFQRTGRPFTLMLLDIDHFKRINDFCGHQAGDRIIREVANHLARNVRSIDTVARWGGEEFLVILPESGAQEAWHLAQRLREQIAAHQVLEQGRPISATVSIGLASVRPDEELDELLRRADENLYAAKNGGRNRVVGSEPDGPPSGEAEACAAGA